MKDMEFHEGAGVGARLRLAARSEGTLIRTHRVNGAVCSYGRSPRSCLPPEAAHTPTIVLGLHAVALGLHGSSWNFMVNTR